MFVYPVWMCSLNAQQYQIYMIYRWAFSGVCRSTLESDGISQCLCVCEGVPDTFRHCTVAVKLCVRAAANVQFFNFFMRLLFKCGFYSRAVYRLGNVCKARKCGLAHVKRKCNIASATKLFVNKHWDAQSIQHAKTSRIHPYIEDIGPPFSSRGSYLSMAYAQIGFGKMRLLFRYGFYTRLYDSYLGQSHADSVDILPWLKKNETTENHDVERTLFDMLDHQRRAKSHSMAVRWALTVHNRM